MSLGDPQLLFVGGFSQSGTSALVRVLNSHPEVAIGQERYWMRFANWSLSRTHFERARLAHMQEGDTHPHAQKLFARNGVAQKVATASLVGDKYPAIATCYQRLWSVFGSPRILYIVRNPVSVMESRQNKAEKANPDAAVDTVTQGVSEWNQSVADTLAAIRNGANITVVCYERLFSNVANVLRLFEALKLSWEDVDRTRIDSQLETAADLWNAMTCKRETLRNHVALNADFSSYRALAQDACILR